MTVIPDTNTKMAGLSGTYEQRVTYTADGQVASTTYPAAGGLSKETVTTYFDEETSVAEWMGGGFGWGTYVASSRTDVFGRLSYLDLGNTYGTVVSYGYEVGTDRLMNVKLDRERIGGTELDISYAYDDAGNVLSAKDKPTAAGRAADQQCYQYDALRHLTEAWTPATGNCALAKSPAALGGSAPYWASFQYDDVLGNRTDETYRTRGLAGDVDGGVTTTRGYDYEGSRDLNGNGNSTDAGEFAGPHAVTSITTDGPSGTTGTSFTYDNAGRTRTQTQDSDYLTSKLSLGWDHESELASTSTATTVYPEPEPGPGDDDSDGDQSSGTVPDRGTGTTTTVTGRNLYTADGDRLVRTAPDGTITVYLGGQEITKAANGTVTAARYYSFGGQTVAMRTANGLGGVTSLINDPQGTALASVHNTNWTTTSVAKHYTLPFGEQRGGVSAPGDHEFLGKVRDGATGLTLVGARWYDETVGRFLTVDPVMDLTDPQQWNAYTYANNNPTTWWDPDGLEPRPWHQDGVSFSHPKSKAYLRSEGSNSDGWNTGWGTGTFSGPMTISTGIPDLVDGSGGSWGDPVELHGDYEGPQHTPGYDLLAGVYSPGTERALRNAGVVSSAAEAVNLGLYLACLQKNCSAYEDTSNGDAALSAATLLLPVPNFASHGDEVADASKTADEIPWGAACSFAGATPVLMADGSRKQIRDIEVGDKVIATDPESGEQAARKVTHVWVHQDDLFEFEVDGELIVTTEDHPFWSVTDQAWEGTEDLALGERVRAAEGRTLTVTREVDFSTLERDPAYNLTVSGLHTYHVGERDVLVHNTGGPPSVDNERLRNLVTTIFKGVGNPNQIGDGTTMASAAHEVGGGTKVEGRNHVAKAEQMRSALTNFLSNDTIRVRGGKTVPVVRSARDVEVAQGLIAALDDSLTGRYSGLSGYRGIGCR